MDITLKRAVKHLGIDYPQGQQIVADNIALQLIELGAATRTIPLPVPMPVMASTNLTGMVDFSGMLMGALVSGQWFSQPSIFRLLLNGTGTVTLDSKDAGGVITTGVFSAMLTNAVNQIEFPYAGDGAIQIRASLTGTATAQVI